jgi:hypothetical protein
MTEKIIVFQNLTTLPVSSRATSKSESSNYDIQAFVAEEERDRDVLYKKQKIDSR